jgi:RNA polymerase sigma factor (sigma-70 family)
MHEFEDVFDDLYRRAYRIAFRLLGNREEAKDIAQEAVARAGLRWAKLGQTTYYMAWVARVTGNLVIDNGRRRMRERLPLRAGAPTAEETSTVERLHLRAVLGALPRRQREVVTLRYLADLPETTVAELLGCSVGTVKRHASRGLAALRASLAEPEEYDVRAPR